MAEYANLTSIAVIFCTTQIEIPVANSTAITIPCDKSIFGA